MRRICFLLPAHWDARMGGAEYQASIIMRELVSTQRYELYYLARRTNPHSHPSDYQLLTIQGPRSLRKYGFFFDAPSLFRILREVRPHVIYQRVACAYTGIAAFYARRSESKLIWHVANDRDVLPYTPRFRDKFLISFIERKIFQYGIANADIILTQTHQQDELLRKNYGRIAAQVIPNMHPFPLEEIEKTEPLKIVWIGGFKPHKRPEIFLRLAEDFCDVYNCQFIMIGPGMDLPRWRPLISKGKELRNVRLLGELPQDRVNAILAQAHILLNTSEFEGFPNTFIQAWMRKIPTLSLDVDPDGILADKRLGFRSGTYDGLKKDLTRLIAEPGLREEMGQRAQTYAYEMHSTRNMSHLLNFFDM